MRQIFDLLTFNLVFCLLKPRLPDAGYAYSEAAIEDANAHQLAGTVAVLQHYPGCKDFPL